MGVGCICPDVCTCVHCTCVHCTCVHCTCVHCTCVHCTCVHCTCVHCICLLCTQVQTVYVLMLYLCPVYVCGNCVISTLLIFGIHSAYAASYWLSLRLQLVGVFIITAVAFMAMLEHHLSFVDPGQDVWGM